MSRRVMDEDVPNTPEEWEEASDRCPYCTPIEIAQHAGCNQCHFYRCIACNEVRPWSDGGTDSAMCDACWSVTSACAEEIATMFTQGDNRDDRTSG